MKTGNFFFFFWLVVEFEPHCVREKVYIISDGLFNECYEAVNPKNLNLEGNTISFSPFQEVYCGHTLWGNIIPISTPQGFKCWHDVLEQFHHPEKVHPFLVLQSIISQPSEVILCEEGEKKV